MTLVLVMFHWGWLILSLSRLVYNRLSVGVYVGVCGSGGLFYTFYGVEGFFCRFLLFRFLVYYHWIPRALWGFYSGKEVVIDDGIVLFVLFGDVFMGDSFCFRFVLFFFAFVFPYRLFPCLLFSFTLAWSLI